MFRDPGTPVIRPQISLIMDFLCLTMSMSLKLLIIRHQRTSQFTFIFHFALADAISVDAAQLLPRNNRLLNGILHP